ncbi:hypothetical protein Hanom_Chr16g01443511 [Helianthus anomalus]
MPPSRQWTVSFILKTYEKTKLPFSNSNIPPCGFISITHIEIVFPPNSPLCFHLTHIRHIEIVWL